MSDLAIVLVHYRTPALLVEAAEALLGEVDASGLAAEIVVVDNGSEPPDRLAWSRLPLRRIDPGANLGYAGGVRAGVEATSAPHVVAMNPDVLVLEGCLARLVAELESGAAAAGPQFFWDRGRRFHLPPTESRTAGAELRAALARRFPGFAHLSRAARRAWRRHARRHWEASAPLASTALSGALLAFRRDVWDRVGPFDEAFRLYFEETDWLLRLRAAGFESRFVPAARAVHLFAQSSVQEPRASAWFGEAERLFRRRHHGAWLARSVELLGSAPPRRGRERSPARGSLAAPALRPEELGAHAPGAWVEAALSESGFPAAGERRLEPGGEWQLPPEIWQRLPPGDLWVRGVDAGGRESAPIRLRRAAALGVE
jgi:N-acetylglucosaminyl-diphospho-decaprenol L-rhamnosyltransferase